MCFPGVDPVTLSTIASVGMQGASMFMNNRAQNQVVSARNNVMNNSMATQAAHQTQANQITDESQAGFTREAQDKALADETARRTQALQGAVTPLSTQALPTDPSAPKIIESQLGSRIADALSYGKTMAGKNATLGAYSGNQFNNNLALNDSALKLGQVEDFSKGDSNVAGMQLNSANQAGNNSAGIADLFRLGGSAAGLYGMTAPRAAPTPAQYSLGSPATFGGKPYGLGLKFQSL